MLDQVGMQLILRTLTPVRSLLAVVALTGVGASASADLTTRSITPFTEEALQRGLEYQMQPYPVAYGYLGYGCGFADLNNNGHPDIIVLGALDGTVGIFENDGTGHFIDRSDEASIPALPQGSAFAVGDYTGNGLPDLYLTQVGLPNVLMRNDGDFQFTDMTESAGVGDEGAGKGAAWGDFTGNGWLDLYVTNYNGIVPGTADLDNRLYMNLGDGTFEDVSEVMGVADSGLGFQPVWFDMNRNGWLDLYLANDRGHLTQQKNRLWRNDGGELADISEPSGAGIALFSMGIAAGDFNRNGYPDLYITNIPGGGGFDNPLLINQGDETFTEESFEAGVNNPHTSWGSIFFDFTNNGWLDLYVNNMWVANTLFLNTGTWPLEEIGQPAGVGGTFGSNMPSFSSAVADVNGNGAMDLLINNLNGNVQLFINHEGIKRNWIRYHIIGEHPNHHAVGANVDTRFGDEWRYQEIYAGGNGYLGQNELTVHVGAGDAEQADAIVINWPGSDTTRTLTNYPVNQIWEIHPPDQLGDSTGDGMVGFDDFLVLADCFGDQVVPGCEVMDFSGDGFVGEADAISFLEIYNGDLTDCNDSGTWDLLEILLDPSLDTTGNWVIDSCESTVVGDLNGDGTVGSEDLLILLSQWGPCGRSCPADLNGDGFVDGRDLGLLLANWGVD